jgi:hypothetical protein
MPSPPAAEHNLSSEGWVVSQPSAECADCTAWNGIAVAEPELIDALYSDESILDTEPARCFVFHLFFLLRGIGVVLHPPNNRLHRSFAGPLIAGVGRIDALPAPRAEV